MAAIKQVAAHPTQHPITLELSNKEKITIMTSWGKEGDVLKADIDPFNHPAWQEDGAKNYVNANSERIKQFEKKFGGFGNL
jgi:ribosomal protein L31